MIRHVFLSCHPKIAVSVRFSNVPINALSHVQSIPWILCNEFGWKESSNKNLSIGKVSAFSTHAQPDSNAAEQQLKAMLRDEKEHLKKKSQRYLRERTAKFAAFRANSQRQSKITSARVIAAKNYLKLRGLEYFDQRKRRREELWKARREFLLNQREKMRTYLADKRLQMHRMRVWTIPNIITMGRMATCPAIGWLILNGEYDLALAGSAVMGATDFLDGYIARNYDQQSLLGSFLDPLADKVFMSTLGGAMAWTGLLPWELALLMLGRDAGLIGGMMLARQRTRKEGEAFFDLKSVNFEVNPSLLSKVNTGLQMGIVAAALTKPVFGFPSPDFFEYMCWGVGASTVMSGVSYMGAAGVKPMKKLIDLRRSRKKATSDAVSSSEDGGGPVPRS